VHAGKGPADAAIVAPVAGVLIVLFVLLVAAGAYYAWKKEQERKRQIAAFADRHGFRFFPDDDPDHDEEYAQFEIFRRGHSRAAQNTLVGVIELFGSSRPLRLGDFRYRVTTSNGKTTSTTTYRFSYLIVHPPWATPPLLVRPEGVFDKLAGAFGFDDIDFESEEFSRRFYVKSTDKRFAYDVLHPRMMEFLLAEGPPMLDIENGALCLSDGSKRWTPEQFDQRLAFVRRFCELWPRHLVKDLAT
jgi:hypothetical protein